VPPLLSVTLAGKDPPAHSARIDAPFNDEHEPAWIRVVGYMLVVVAIWNIVGRYKGITHDALLYSLQGVARLRPDPLAGDIFLRFQSQDEFSVFSSISSRAIQLLGIDHAAALLTFFSLLCWFILAWAIARRLQNGKLALLSLALLMLIPGWYSAKGVFRYAEPFMTARGMSEAIALAALLLLFTNRRVSAAALVALALLVHPLMAFPVALFVAIYWLPLTNWRRFTAACALLVVGAVAGSFALGYPDPLMRGDWLEVSRQRSSFLFTDRWFPADWEVVTQILLTLTLGVSALPAGLARKALAGALCIGVAGLLLTLISSHIELKLLLQGQPWRWLWLGRFLATALLPLLVITLCRQGDAGKVSAMLLASAWLLSGAGSHRELPPVGLSGLLCLLALVIWTIRGLLQARILLVLKMSAVGVLILVGIVFLSVLLVAIGSDFSSGRDPVWIQRINDVVVTPGIAAAIATAAWMAVVVKHHRGALVLFSVAAVSLLLGAGPESARRWAYSIYDDSSRERFAHWRTLIPNQSEVLWQGGASATWFLLERRSYLTISQGAGSVFSEQTTLELLRRANVLAPLVPPGKWFVDPRAKAKKANDLTPQILRAICVDPALSFVVSEQTFPGFVAEAEWPGKADFLHLYNCDDFRPERIE
jgi:hypothetical protein